VKGHIFPFSPKRGTPAARMPQVSPVIAKLRARRLREACERQRASWLDGLAGSRQRVLVEKDGFGHAENFAPVQVGIGGAGEIVEVRITGVDNGILTGVPA
jgi:threonylcarbamoyladenosine tRNA methylthiotransferase MtaB